MVAVVLNTRVMCTRKVLLPSINIFIVYCIHFTNLTLNINRIESLINCSSFAKYFDIQWTMAMK